MLALDEALDELTSLDARLSRVVELKFFAGLTTSEAAHALGVSTATVERDWTVALNLALPEDCRFPYADDALPPALTCDGVRPDFAPSQPRRRGP